jgi:lysophospholipase L1-like esterase
MYRTKIYKQLLLALIFGIMAFSIPPKTTVYLIGDSTMANKEIKAFPETGWGMPFAYFFDSTIIVDNRAKNGRSTQSFITEGLWEPVVNMLKEGDYVFVQFGHNDEVPTKKSYTPPDQFKTNLAKFVTETRNKKAVPILITPVARRMFDSAGRILETHTLYAQLVKDVATQYQVPLIDLDQKSQQLLTQFGPEASKYLYNYLSPGENPHYPEGKEDNTHFSELGARKMAEIVLKEIKNLRLGLVDHIRVVLEKKK